LCRSNQYNKLSVADPNVNVEGTMWMLFRASLYTAEEEVIDLPSPQPSTEEKETPADLPDAPSQSFPRDNQLGFACPKAHEWFRRKGVNQVVKHIFNRNTMNDNLRLGGDAEEVCSKVLNHFCEWAARLIHMQHPYVLNHEDWLNRLPYIMDQGANNSNQFFADYGYDDGPTPNSQAQRISDRNLLAAGNEILTPIPGDPPSFISDRYAFLNIIPDQDMTDPSLQTYATSSNNFNQWNANSNNWMNQSGSDNNDYSYPHSVHLLRCANTLLHFRMHHAIHELLRGGQASVSVINVLFQALVGMLDVSGEMVKAEFISTSVTNGLRTIMEYLDNFDPNTMLRDERDRHSIFELVKLVENRYLSLIRNDTQLYQDFLNNLKLDLAKKFLETQNLQVRIMGLNQIKASLDDSNEKYQRASRELDSNRQHRRRRVEQNYTIQQRMGSRADRNHVGAWPSQQAMNNRSSSTGSIDNSSVNTATAMDGNNRNRSLSPNPSHVLDPSPNPPSSPASNDAMIHESDNEYDNNNLEPDNQYPSNYYTNDSFSADEEEEEEDEYFSNNYNQAASNISKAVSWLVQNRILEHLLSPDNLHLQLLKRCTCIPKFLSDHNQLKDQDVLNVWKACVQSSHESIRHSIYNLLNEMMYYCNLSPHQYCILNHNLSQMKHSEHDSQSISTLNTLTVKGAGIYYSPDDPPLGLYIMWQLCQDESESSIEVKSNALRFLNAYLYMVARQENQFCETANSNIQRMIDIEKQTLGVENVTQQPNLLQTKFKILNDALGWALQSIDKFTSIFQSIQVLSACVVVIQQAPFNDHHNNQHLQMINQNFAISRTIENDIFFRIVSDLKRYLATDPVLVESSPGMPFGNLQRVQCPLIFSCNLISQLLISMEEPREQDENNSDLTIDKLFRPEVLEGFMSLMVPPEFVHNRPTHTTQGVSSAHPVSVIMAMLNHNNLWRHPRFQRYLVEYLYKYCSKNLNLVNLDFQLMKLIVAVLENYNILCGQLGRKSNQNDDSHCAPFSHDIDVNQMENNFLKLKPQLHGIDLLWRIILSVENSDVAKLATRQLIMYSLLIQPAEEPSPSSSSSSQHVDFMKKCMETLQEVGNDFTKAIRCLKATSDCASLAMDKCKDMGLLKGLAQPHGLLGLGVPIRINVQLCKWTNATQDTTAKGKERLTVEVQSNDKMYILRRKIWACLMKEYSGGALQKDSSSTTDGGREDGNNDAKSTTGDKDDAVTVYDVDTGAQEIASSTPNKRNRSGGKKRHNSDVKDEVAKALSFPAQSYEDFSTSCRLICGGKELKDDEAILPMYNVQNSSTVHVVNRHMRNSNVGGVNFTGNSFIGPRYDGKLGGMGGGKAILTDLFNYPIEQKEEPTVRPIEQDTASPTPHIGPCANLPTPPNADVEAPVPIVDDDGEAPVPDMMDVDNGQDGEKDDQRGEETPITTSESNVFNHPVLSPIVVLLEPKNMDILFDLLRVTGNQELTNLVWSILMRIPTYKLLLSDMKEPSKVKGIWSKWLPNDGSCCNLLYTLKLIESQVSSDSRARVEKVLVGETKEMEEKIIGSSKRRKIEELQSDQTPASSTWCDDFVSSGGLDHIISILLQQQDLAKENILFHLRCINSLLKLLSFFLTEETSTNRFSNDTLQRILTFTLQTITKSCSRELEAASDTGEDDHDTVASTEVNKEFGEVSENSLALIKAMLKIDGGVFLTTVVFDNGGGKTSETPKLFTEAVLSSLIHTPNLRVRLRAADIFKEGWVNSEKVTQESLKAMLSMLVRATKFCKEPGNNSKSDELFSLIKAILGKLCTELTDAKGEEKMTLTKEDKKLFTTWCKRSIGVRKRGTKRKKTGDDKNDEYEVFPPDNRDSLPLSLSKLSIWLCERVMSSEIFEERRNESLVDCYLIGVLECLTSLVEKFGEEMKEHVGKVGGIVSHVFIKCLFEIPTETNHGILAAPKCKTYRSRIAAFNLLTCLCIDCNVNFDTVVQLLLGNKDCGGAEVATVSQSTRTGSLGVGSFYYNPMTLDKSSSGYVGLRNLGATCYMNSLVQQFFMVEPLRHGLLSCVEGGLLEGDEKVGDGEGEDSTDDSPKKDNLLYQLQLVFAHLQESEKKAFDMKGVCEAYKDWDGNPTNPGEQQDVDEFYAGLMDKLEGYLKKLPQKNLLKDIFGGKICNQIICQVCKKKSERLEDSLVLSLDVKGKRSILDSLDLYVAGEMLDGENKYFCSHCQAKCDSLKRACVENLPNTMILHLKRFEFDLELMRKVKVNDYVEFPRKINMKRYTKVGLEELNEEDGREEGYYDYELKGVLIHQGTSDSGHYYSIAKERGGKEEWFMFNDVSVTNFNPNEINDQCFGGKKQSQRYDHQSQRMVTLSVDKTFSAYMLFYERKIRVFNEGVEQPAKKAEKVSEDDSNVWHPPYDGVERASELVPKGIFERIWETNKTFLREKHLFSTDFGDFLFKISKDKDIEEGSDLVRVVTHYVFDTLIFAKDKSNLGKFFGLLKKWYSKSTESCESFGELLYENQWLRNIFLKCGINEVRNEFIELLKVVFKVLCPLHRDIYYKLQQGDEDDEEAGKDDGGGTKSGTNEEDSEDDPLTPQGHDEDCLRFADKKYSQFPFKQVERFAFWRGDSVIAKIITKLLSLIPEVPANYKRVEQLFLVLATFASVGRDESIFLIRCSIIPRLVDMFQGPKANIPSHLLTIDGSAPQTCARRKMDTDNLNAGSLLKVIATVIGHTVVHEAATSEEETDVKTILDLDQYVYKNETECAVKIDPEEGVFILPRRDYKLLTQVEFLKKLVESSRDGDMSQAICSRLAWRNLHVSTVIANACGAHIKEAKGSDFEQNALPLLVSFLYMLDSGGPGGPQTFDFRHERIHAAMRNLLIGIHSNIAYSQEFSHCWKYLIFVFGIDATERQCIDGINAALFYQISNENYHDARIAALNYWFMEFEYILKMLMPCNVESAKNGLEYQKRVCRGLIQICEIGEMTDEVDVLKVKIGLGGRKIADGASTEITVEGEKNKLFSDSEEEEEKEVSLESRFLPKKDEQELLECEKSLAKWRLFATLVHMFPELQKSMNNVDFSKGKKDKKVHQTFYDYFALLNFGLQGLKNDLELDLILASKGGIHEAFLTLLWDVDSKCRDDNSSWVYEDQTRGEMIQFYKVLCNIHPAVLKEFLNDFKDDKEEEEDSQDSAMGRSSGGSRSNRAMQQINMIKQQQLHQQEQQGSENTDVDLVQALDYPPDRAPQHPPLANKILDFYLSYEHRYFKWNDKYASSFFELLYMICSYSEKFMNIVISHDNFEWYLDHFFYGSPGAASAKCYTYVQRLLGVVMARSATMRDSCWRKAMKEFRNTNISTMGKASLMVFWNCMVVGGGTISWDEHWRRAEIEIEEEAAEVKTVEQQHDLDSREAFILRFVSKYNLLEHLAKNVLNLIKEARSSWNSDQDSYPDQHTCWSEELALTLKLVDFLFSYNAHLQEPDDWERYFYTHDRYFYNIISSSVRILLLTSEHGQLLKNEKHIFKFSMNAPANEALDRLEKHVIDSLVHAGPPALLRLMNVFAKQTLKLSVETENVSVDFESKLMTPFLDDCTFTICGTALEIILTWEGGLDEFISELPSVGPMLESAEKNARSVCITLFAHLYSAAFRKNWSAVADDMNTLLSWYKSGTALEKNVLVLILQEAYLLYFFVGLVQFLEMDSVNIATREQPWIALTNEFIEMVANALIPNDDTAGSGESLKTDHIFQLVERSSKALEGEATVG